ELLAWHAGQAAEGTPPTFAAHGSASESGSDKWHWLNPDPTSGAGGSQVIGAFAARGLADDLTAAVANRFKRAAVMGEAELVGQAPPGRPGGGGVSRWRSELTDHSGQCL